MEDRAGRGSGTYSFMHLDPVMPRSFSYVSQYNPSVGQGFKILKVVEVATMDKVYTDLF